VKTRIARDVAAARRPGRPISAAMGTAGVAQAEADRARIRTVLRAPSDWRAPAPVPRLSALNVGAVNDPLEHDANRIADQVMQENVQKQSTALDVGDRRAPESVSKALRSPGQPLDTSSRGYFEPRFGHDFSGVRVHSDAGAAQSARDINARAYTVGNNIVFGAGRFAPGAAAGRQLLAHELAHTIQQRGVNAGVRLPRWSPDGETIAYLDAGDLWLARPDGSQRRFVLWTGWCTTWCSDVDFAWSPDSKWIILRTPKSLSIVRVSDGEIIPLPFTSSWQQPTWQP